MSEDLAIARSTLSRQQEHRLRTALRSVIGAWNEPGPMGTIYEMTRAVSAAKDVLDEIEQRKESAA